MSGRLTIALALALLPHSAVRAAEDFAFFHENVLGTSLELRVRAENQASAERAEMRVLGEIDRLDAIFSGYKADSEFRRWQETINTPVNVSPELFHVLKASDRWRDITRGAFDPRVEAISRLWSAGAKKGQVPSEPRRAAIKELTARPAWRLDETAMTAERLSNCPLTLNAIAKGYIVDKAAEAGLDPKDGVLGLMVCVGGDLRVAGDFSRRIGVTDPRRDSETTTPIAHVNLKGRALATSGGYQRGFRIGGEWYSHIIDPRTASPAGKILGSTVIAEHATDADALATAFSVLPVEESLRIAEATPGVDCLIVADDGKVWRSSGWRTYEVAAPVRVTFRSLAPEQKPTKAESLPEDYETAVKFEIAGTGGNDRRYRRPYVAVWVTDKEGVAVKTLTLWIQKTGSRWHPDLRRWYREDQVRKLIDDTDFIETISRATRPPGKYEVIWDGKDDNGKPLTPGAYTVSIEAAREHGTYQIIRKEVNLGDKPFVEELKGNAEIKSASIQYRRVKPGK